MKIHQAGAAIAVGFVLIAPAAFAGDAFTGYSVQVETGYAHNAIMGGTPTASVVGTTYVGTRTATVSGNNVALFINPSYSFALAPKWRLAVGIDHQFILADTGSVKSYFGGQSNVGVVPYYNTVTDQTNLYIAPGYVIDDSQLVFAKIGYSFESISIDSKDSRAKTASGYVIGLGYKHMLARHIFGTVEAHYSEYQKLSPVAALGPGITLRGNTGTPSVVDVLIGVGFQF